MSPRPPPKIPLRHDWARGEVPLGSTVDQQPEGEIVRQSPEEVARRAKFFQPTQPIPKRICDRSGQPDNTQDVFVVKGEASRSQEIDVKFFTKNSVLQMDQGNLISRKTWSVFTRMSEMNKLMIDQGNLINTTSQYKKTLKFFMRLGRSTPTMSQFVKELRKTWTSKFRDCHILL